MYRIKSRKHGRSHHKRSKTRITRVRRGGLAHCNRCHMYISKAYLVNGGKTDDGLCDRCRNLEMEKKKSSMKRYDLS
jgi:hypothetical protein